MRNLQTELNKLIDYANQNEWIRGLVLQGSFINTNAPIDKYSDLDPLFYVSDVNQFIHDDAWKNQFGEVMSYFHDEWDMKDNLKGYTRLTIYQDGFKIDFGFQDVKLAKYANDMELYKVYVDKDAIIPVPEARDESKFYVKQPTEQEYQDILRDFFFDTSYVVKTIYRDEVTFNQYMMMILHKKITQLAIWYVGVKHAFLVNPGIYGRYIKRYLSDEEYELLKSTYPSSDYDSVKMALIQSFEAVRYFGKYIADELHFTYPATHDADMYAYCQKELKLR